MRTLRQAVKTFEHFNQASGIFIGYFVLSMMLIIAFEVLARYLFSSPTVWANQLTQLIFGGYMVMGGAYTLLNKGHIRVDIFYNHLKNPRIRASVDAAISLLFFLFCGLLLYESIPIVWQATITDERVQGLAWRVAAWPVKWTLPIGTLLLLIQGTIQLARDISVAVSGREIL